MFSSINAVRACLRAGLSNARGAPLPGLTVPFSSGEKMEIMDKSFRRVRRMFLHTFGALLATLALVAIHPTAAIADDSQNGDWPMFGQNLQNTAATGSNSGKDVSKLKLKWTFTTGGDVSARAAVVNGVAYFPDWGGNLWAVNAKNGNAVWAHQLSDYGLPAQHPFAHEPGRREWRRVRRNAGRRLAAGDQGVQGHLALEDAAGIARERPVCHDHDLAGGVRRAGLHRRGLE